MVPTLHNAKDCPFFVREEGAKRCKRKQIEELSCEDILGLSLQRLYSIRD